MKIHDWIHQHLLQGTNLEMLDDDIYSVIPAKDRAHHYDRAAVFYDLVIGNRFYNRMMWGNWPVQYERFCEQALGANNRGVVLDAGCGSLVFTAKAYVKSTRPVVLLDRSLGMLKRGRDRLIKYAGVVPGNMLLIQADILHMPFTPCSFSTVQSFGMLHIFEDTDALLHELMRVKSADGAMFVSSLATNEQPGSRYLRFLQKQNEVALCLPSEILHRRLAESGSAFKACSIGNMAYFAHDGQNA